MDSDIQYDHKDLYLNKDISILKAVFLSEDNIYKIVQGYKLKTGEEKVERKIYENIEPFYNAFISQMKGYDGNIISWVETMDKTFIDTFYIKDKTVVSKNKSKNGSGYLRTDNFTMEDYKHYVPMREPINTTLNQRNKWYSHQNKHKVMTNKITKPEFVGRTETGNYVPKQSPWSEAYMKVKSAAAASSNTAPTSKSTQKSIDSSAYKPSQLNDDEEYNYELF
jgi:hypothetical protein